MHLYLSFLVSFFLAIGLGSAQGVQSLPPELIAYSDIVFYNGKILTVDDQFSIVEAVAIRDGKFLAVGDDQRILSLAGPQTRRVDLQGRSVVPGFIDTHLHMAFVGNQSKAGTGEEILFRDVASGLEELRAITAKYPAGMELYIGGPSNKPLLLDVTLAELDAATPNHPVAITCPNNQVVVNSLMLKKVALDTPGVLKDETGKPTGQLRGGASGDIIYAAMTWPDIEDEMARQIQEFRYYTSQGLTTFMGKTEGLAFSIFRGLWVKGKLEPRVRVIHQFLRQNANPEAYLKRLGNMTDFGDDKLKITAVTVQVVNGSSGTGSARTSMSKLMNRPAQDPASQSDAGRRFYSPELDPYGPYGQNKWEETGDVSTSDRRNILLANRYGWTVAGLHSSGDMSNTILLEAFEEAHREKSLVGRHFGIDHGLMWKPEHFSKLKEMDITPSVYSKAMYDNDGLVQMYGADQVYWMQPVKSLIDFGIKPAAEADDRPPYSAPLFHIQNWVTRIDDTGRQLDPSEKVDRKEALLMYTRWAARYSGEEHLLGSIEPGKLGDLVVLGGDYLTFPENELDKLRVLMTVVGGKVIHEVAGAF